MTKTKETILIVIILLSIFTLIINRNPFSEDNFDESMKRIEVMFTQKIEFETLNIIELDDGMTSIEKLLSGINNIIAGVLDVPIYCSRVFICFTENISFFFKDTGKGWYQGRYIGFIVDCVYYEKFDYWLVKDLETGFYVNRERNENNYVYDEETGKILMRIAFGTVEE